MQEDAPPVFPIFRSRITTAVLALTYVGDGEYSVADLARSAQTDTGTMAREVRRLEMAAVVESRRVGRTKLVAANHEAPFYRPLRELATVVLGPAQVLAAELAGFQGIDGAAIFGSWAARVSGEPGPSPVDIDLLVVGRPNRDDLHDAVGRAQDQLGREVHVVVVSPRQWDSGSDAFLAELRSRPLVRVSGTLGTKSSLAAE